MRTTEHKTYVIDDLVDEVDLLCMHFGWISPGHSIDRNDLHTVRKDVLRRLNDVLSEARRRLENGSS